MDFINSFVDWTAGIPSPLIYRLWGAIGTVAAAAERRIFIQTAGGELYPNLYTLLIGGPGIGKGKALEHAEVILKGTKKIHLAANSTSKAALLDQLMAADTKIPINGVNLLEYHSLMALITEFSTLVPIYDEAFLGVMTDLFDNKPNFADIKRTTKSVDITNPQINLLAGTTPAQLGGLLPESAWNTGFMSRLVMIYSADKPEIDFFKKHPLKVPSEIVQNISAICAKIGEITFSEEAISFTRKWFLSHLEPIPEHSKLTYYCERRQVLFAKLAIISSLSRGEQFQISLNDCKRAQHWMLQAEEAMPNIFREINQKNDSGIIQELHMFMWQIWAIEKKPIHESRLFYFLQNKMPNEKIPRLIEIAERSNIITKILGTRTYRPRPRHEHGVE